MLSTGFLKFLINGSDFPISLYEKLFSVLKRRYISVSVKEPEEVILILREYVSNDVLLFMIKLYEIYKNENSEFFTNHFEFSEIIFLHFIQNREKLQLKFNSKNNSGDIFSESIIIIIIIFIIIIIIIIIIYYYYYYYYYLIIFLKLLFITIILGRKLIFEVLKDQNKNYKLFFFILSALSFNQPISKYKFSNSLSLVSSSSSSSISLLLNKNNYGDSNLYVYSLLSIAYFPKNRSDLLEDSAFFNQLMIEISGCQSDQLLYYYSKFLRLISNVDADHNKIFIEKKNFTILFNLISNNKINHSEFRPKIFFNIMKVLIKLGQTHFNNINCILADPDPDNTILNFFYSSLPLFDVNLRKCVLLFFSLLFSKIHENISLANNIVVIKILLFLISNIKITSDNEESLKVEKISNEYKLADEDAQSVLSLINVIMHILIKNGISLDLQQFFSNKELLKEYINIFNYYSSHGVKCQCIIVLILSCGFCLVNNDLNDSIISCFADNLN
jgi:hypothetical protein